MKVQNWHIKGRVAVTSEKAFIAGQHEVFVIWTAALPEDDAARGPLVVDECIVPAQTPGATQDGVYVHIEGKELHKIQLGNFKAGRRSVIQLHTHPGSDVRMSALDREWEVVRHVGALSIIVPHYGRFGLSLGRGANVYEREEDDWRLWSAEEARERLVIT